MLRNNKTINSGNVKAILLVIFLVIVVLITVVVVKNNQNPNTNAAIANTKIVLAPNQSQLPATVKVYVDPGDGNQIVFAKIKLQFPKNELKLTSAKISGESFKNAIFATDPATIQTGSNNNAEILLIAGVKPGDQPISKTSEIASLTFEAQSDPVAPTSDNVEVISQQVELIASPERVLSGITGFGSRLFTKNPENINAEKSRETKDLGLTLLVKKDSLGKDYIEATWPNIDSIERPNFINFGIAVRTNADSPPVTDATERRVQADECLESCTRSFDTLASLPQGKYFINLRANFKQKLLVQSPKKYFTIGANGKISLE